MQISVFGLGYVGAVTAGCLAEKGHRILGVDVQRAKVDAFNAGRSPIIEPELSDLLRNARDQGHLEATTDVEHAVASTDLSIICVGTPSLSSGRLNLDFVRKVTEQIRDALRSKVDPHPILFRSTMLPGSTRQMVEDFLFDLADLQAIRVYYCPEFLREGTAVRDFRDPSLAVIGTADGNPPADPWIAELLGGQPQYMNWEGAEMIKYACNYFHALKVGFANEIGRLSKSLNVDGARVMEVVCKDTKLNISPYYLRPGNPFGGSCLPKDVSALSSLARMEGVNLPLLEGTLTSNSCHLDALIKMVTRYETRQIGILGLSFKADTDDLRGSPMVALAETLLGRGYQLRIYDPQLNLSCLMGANEAEIQRRMPHLASLMRSDLGDVLAESDLVIASQPCASLDVIRQHLRPNHHFIDVNGWSALQALPCGYEGFCW